MASTDLPATPATLVQQIAGNVLQDKLVVGNVPIEGADDAIGVGSAVDGLNFVGLGGPAPLLSLNAGALCGYGNGDRHRARESQEN